MIEAPLEVKLNPSELKTQTDASFAPPVDEWSMTFAAVSRTAELPVSITVPDDDIPELGEFMDVTGTATALGQAIPVTKTQIAFLSSDLWRYKFEIDRERVVSSGGSTTFTFRARVWGGRIPSGGLTLTLRPCAGAYSLVRAQCPAGGQLPADMANAFSPGSLVFEWKGDDIGRTCGRETACEKTLTWTATTPNLTRLQKVVFAVQLQGANAQLAQYFSSGSSDVTFLSTAAPAVAEPLRLDWSLTPRPTGTRPFLAGNQIGFRVGFSRKIKLTKAATLRIVLDSGPVRIPCQVDLPTNPHQVTCTYRVALGHYDFDKAIQVGAGGLDLGRTLDNPDDAKESWTTPTIPASAATFPLGFEIRGGGHAFSATPTVQEGFREGAGEQTLKVLISDLAHIPAAQDIVIPISIRDGTTTSSDWRLVQGGSVTIRKGATEGEGTAKIEALRDNINEDNETLLVGGGGGYVVKEGTLELIDAPELFLSATPNRITEGSTDVEVTLKVEIEAAAAVFDADHYVPILLRGEARPGKDYRWYRDRTDPGSTALLIRLPKGQRSAQIVRKLSVLEDHLVEGDEILRLIGAGGFLNVRPTEITLVDADTMPEVILSATPTSVTEGGGAQTIAVTARLAGDDPLPHAVDVTLDISGAAVGWDPGADGGARDYTPAWNPTNRQIAIPAGATSGSAGVTLTVTPVDDDLAEGDEGITIEGAAARRDTDARLTVQPAAVTLVDNDQRRVFVTPTALSIEGGLSKTYRIRLGSRPALGTNEKVRIEPRVPTGALLSVSPLDLEFDTTNWKTDQVVTVTAHTLAEEADVVIAHRVGGGDYLTVTADSVTVSLSEAPDLSLKLDEDSIGENGGVATVTAELASAAAAPVSITVGAAPEAPAVAADFTLSENKTLTIAAGATASTGTVTVTANDNDFYLGADKEVTVSGTVVGHAGVSNPPPLTLTIEEDDEKPSFSIADAEAEEDSGVAFTVTRSGATENAVSVKWTTALDTAEDADAASTADFTAVTTARTLSFAADDTEKTLTVAVTDDSLDEPDEETFLVVLSDPGEPAEIAEDAGEATGTITDNDDPPSFSIADASAAEGESVTFTVTRSGASANAATVKVATAEDDADDADAAGADDYTAIATARTLTFGSGDTTKTVEVRTTEDVLDEPDETFLAVLSEPALAENDPGTGASIAADGGTATGTITDDDATPTGITLTVDEDEVAEDATATAVTVTAAVNGNTRYVDAKSVVVRVGGGTATSGTDYAAVTAFTITIAAGEASGTGSFTLTPTDDTLDESDETLNVSGSAGRSGARITVTRATITITDDDDTPSFSVADASGDEGEAINFTVTRAGAPSNVVTVQWRTRTVDDGATALDFTAAPWTTLTFAAGVTTQTVAVQTTEDTIDEPDETFEARLRRPAKVAGEPGARPTISAATATGTINDDDATPSGITLAVDDDDVDEDAGATEIEVTATVNGSTQYADRKLVTVSVGGGSSTAGTDYAAVTAFTITIDPGDESGTGSFTLNPTDDDLHEGDETLDVTGASGTLTVTKDTITIEDDDADPGISLTASPDSVEEDDEATAITVTAAVGGTIRYPDRKVVTVSVGGGTATSGTDYAAVTAFTITIAAEAASQAGSFTLTPTNDGLYEGDETLDVTGTVTGHTVTKDTITIEDDDADPGITLTASPDSVEEDDGEATTVTVTARVNGTKRYPDAKVVTVSVGGGTATSGTDYAAVPNFTITITAAGASGTGSFTLTPTDDDLYEGDETLDVTGTVTGHTVKKDTVTIEDGDADPGITLSAEPDSVGEDDAATAITVTAAVNGDDIRYPEAKAVTVSVGGGTTRSWWSSRANATTPAGSPPTIGCVSTESSGLDASPRRAAIRRPARATPPLESPVGGGTGRNSLRQPSPPRKRRPGNPRQPNGGPNRPAAGPTRAFRGRAG